MKRSNIVFVVMIIIWEIVVGLVYGLFIRYNETAFANMDSSSTSGNEYSFRTDGQATTTTSFGLDSTMFPFPAAIVVIAIILLIVGLAMIAGYVERVAISSMAYTLLLFALTAQNFFIYRDFWNRTESNNPNVSSNTFNYQYYQQINYVNFGNNPQTSYQYSSASFMDAVGASLALYAGYSAVIGRIGLGEGLLPELHWHILLWRLYIPDNGFPSRAFAFGGALGLISSLILGQRKLTQNNPHYMSSYYIRTLSFLGAIFVWCTFPILVTTDTFDSGNGQIVAMSAQVNIWISLAGSVIGCYLASSYIHRKFCVHDMVFASFSGAIAYSSSTNVNYNPGSAMVIGTFVGFLCALAQTRLKRKINRNGIIDSNGFIFQFLVPSLFAAIFSAILQGVGQSSASITAITGFTTTSTVTYNGSVAPGGRSTQAQGGFQIAGWFISVGFGAVAGAILGLIYYLLDERTTSDEFFNDQHIFGPPREEEVEQGQAIQGGVVKS